MSAFFTCGKVREREHDRHRIFFFFFIMKNAAVIANLWVRYWSGCSFSTLGFSQSFSRGSYPKPATGCVQQIKAKKIYSTRRFLQISIRQDKETLRGQPPARITIINPGSGTRGEFLKARPASVQDAPTSAVLVCRLTLKGVNSLSTS